MGNLGKSQRDRSKARQRRRRRSVHAYEGKKCVFCGGDSRQLFERFDVPIRGCLLCELRFAEFEISAKHCSEYFGDDYFDGGQDGYTDYLATRESMTRLGSRYAQIVSRHIASKGRVLDVGAAAGYQLKAFIDAGWTGEGLEPNKKMAEFARNELGLAIHACTLGTYVPADGPFDLVTMFQVISHVPNPVSALQDIAKITKIDGHCLVETWDYKSLTARIVGKSWHQNSPPRVLYWFTRGLLDQMFASVGFQPVASGRAAKSITGKHAKSLAAHANDSLLGGVVQSVAKLIPDSITVPYPGNDCFWALYRKS